MYHLSKLVVSIISLALLLYSCTSTNATYSERNPQNDNEGSKNNIVEYKDPKFTTSKNAMFLGTVLIGGGAGAIAGYLNPIEKTIGRGKYKDAYGVWHDDGTEKDFSTTTLIGAGAGLLITYLVANMLSPNSGAYEINSKQEQKWLKDINDKILMNSSIVNKFKNESDTISNIFLIPKSSENNFIIDNLDDAFLFSSAFPNSEFSGKLLSKSFSNFKRNELPKLIDYFKKDQTIETVKIHYLNTGSGFSDYINAFRKYPSLKDKAEIKTASSAGSISEYKAYLASFPDGTSAPVIKQKLNIAKEKYKEELRIASEKAEIEARVEKEKKEKAKIEWEKEKERLYNSYSPAERDKLALEISSLKNKQELINSQRDNLIEEKEELDRRAFKALSYNRKLYDELKRQSSKKSDKAVEKRKEYWQLKSKLIELYEKAPWLY